MLDLTMELVRTTLRIRRDLKREAQRTAFEQQVSLQEIFNRALEKYLNKRASQKAKKIIFQTVDLGVPLDRLTRDDIYD